MSPLRNIGPACMAVCISSPVRSRKPVLMKATREAASAMQALRLTLVRRSSSMMPSFTVFGGQAQHGFDAAEQFAGEGHFPGTVHLGLDDVDGPGARVLDAGLALALQVVDGDGRGDHCVQDAFGDFLAAAVEDGRVGHQVADIAHEHQRAAVQRRLRRRWGPCTCGPAFRPRVKVLPPFSTCSVSVPCRMPSQLP